MIVWPNLRHVLICPVPYDFIVCVINKSLFLFVGIVIRLVLGHGIDWHLAQVLIQKRVVLVY